MPRHTFAACPADMTRNDAGKPYDTERASPVLHCVSLLCTLPQCAQQYLHCTYFLLSYAQAGIKHLRQAHASSFACHHNTPAVPADAVVVTAACQHQMFACAVLMEDWSVLSHAGGSSKHTVCSWASWQITRTGATRMCEGSRSLRPSRTLCSPCTSKSASALWTTPSMQPCDRHLA